MQSSRDFDKMMVRLPEGMRARLREIARENHRSMNAQVVAALEKHLKTEAAEHSAKSASAA